MLGGGKDNIFEGRPDLIRENKEMQEELEKIQRQLTELEQIFLELVGSEAGGTNWMMKKIRK